MPVQNRKKAPVGKKRVWIGLHSFVLHCIFDFWFYQTCVLPDQKLLHNLDLFPQSALHGDIFKGSISYCSSTEWNVPCTNAELADNVESELGCLRVRGSQRPCRLFKHGGHFKRSSLTTAQSPPGISEEMISLPATVQWDSLNTGEGQMTFVHRGKWGSVNLKIH